MFLVVSNTYQTSLQSVSRMMINSIWSIERRNKSAQRSHGVSHPVIKTPSTLRFTRFPATTLKDSHSFSWEMIMESRFWMFWTPNVVLSASKTLSMAAKLATRHLTLSPHQPTHLSSKLSTSKQVKQMHQTMLQQLLTGFFLLLASWLLSSNSSSDWKFLLQTLMIA